MQRSGDLGIARRVGVNLVAQVAGREAGVGVGDGDGGGGCAEARRPGADGGVQGVDGGAVTVADGDYEVDLLCVRGRV